MSADEESLVRLLTPSAVGGPDGLTSLHRGLKTCVLDDPNSWPPEVVKAAQVLRVALWERLIEMSPRLGTGPAWKSGDGPSP